VALPLLSVFIASLYFHSTISKLAQTSPYLTQFIKKRGRGFLPPLTSVPFGAPTNAPRFKQIVFWSFCSTVQPTAPVRESRTASAVLLNRAEK